jgi:hypothetical protein
VVGGDHAAGARPEKTSPHSARRRAVAGFRNSRCLPAAQVDVRHCCSKLSPAAGPYSKSTNRSPAVGDGEDVGQAHVMWVSRRMQAASQTRRRCQQGVGGLARFGLVQQRLSAGVGAKHGRGCFAKRLGVSPRDSRSNSPAFASIFSPRERDERQAREARRRSGFRCVTRSTPPGRSRCAEDQADHVAASAAGVAPVTDRPPLSMSARSSFRSGRGGP